MTFIQLRNRTVLSLKGPDKETFLQGLITNDVTLLQTQEAIYTALLSPQGKFLYDFFMTYHEDAVYLEVEAHRAQDLFKHLSLYKLRYQVQLEDLTDKMHIYSSLDTEQPNAAAFLKVYQDPRHPDMGWRILSLSQDLSPLDPFEIYDQKRLSLGIPDGSRDMTIAKAIPLECGLDELQAISWTKGCYMGQELTARTRYRGVVRKRLIPVMIEGPAPAPHTPVFLEDKEVGEMLSSCGAQGLIRLRLEVLGASLTCADATLTPFVPAWMQLPAVEYS